MQQSSSNASELFIEQVPYRKLDPIETIKGTDGKTVGDYWSWAFSNILVNMQRGVFAEFLVATALGLEGERPMAWGGYDLEFDSVRLEIKSSAYLQGWEQRALSRPVFNIGARRQLNEDGVSYEAEARYVADYFVFCLYADTNALNADILDVGRWEFYVMSTEHLTKAVGSAKTISLARVRELALMSTFATLRDTVVQLARTSAKPLRE